MNLNKITSVVTYILDRPSMIALSCLIWYWLDPELSTKYARIHLIIACTALVCDLIRKATKSTNQ